MVKMVRGSSENPHVFFRRSHQDPQKIIYKNFAEFFERNTCGSEYF